MGFLPLHGDATEVNEVDEVMVVEVVWLQRSWSGAVLVVARVRPKRKQ